MAFIKTNRIQIDGIATTIPQKTINNKGFELHSEKENEQFIKTTGIHFRRIVPNGVTAADLCYNAANQLIQKLNWSKEDINILIFISQTPDYKIPCTATILQDKLGLPKTTLAFDINLGCSAFVYGLSVISSLLEKTNGKALLLVGDTSSTCINQRDKTTAPLFSDAGSACALSFNLKAKPIYFNLQSDGAGFDAIITKDGGSRNPYTNDSFKVDLETGRSNADMFLNGIKVFNFSRKEVAKNILHLLTEFNIDQNLIDFYYLHQANKLMNDTIAKKLNVDIQKTPQTLKEFGNTGAASIPITICQHLSSEPKPKNLVVLAGFGVGLSWGSCVLSIQNTVILPIIEL